MTRVLTAVTLWGLLLACSALVSGARRVEMTEQRVAALAVCVVGAYAVGRLLAHHVAAAYGFAVALGIAALLVLTPDGLSGGALAGPLGYGNANGALAAQGAAAALVPAVVCRRSLVRVAALALSAALAVLTWRTGSLAATVAACACSAVVLGLLAFPAGDARRSASRVVVAAAGALVVAAAALTVALGAHHAPSSARDSPVERVVDRTLSERRVVLWSESLDLLKRNPATGVGIGRFASASPTARSDPDARWAHSAFLQHGAEAGSVGLLALLGLCAATYRALWRTAASEPLLSVVGACAAGAVLAQASIDYVLHFPVVPLLTALTVGVCARPSSPVVRRRR